MRPRNRIPSREAALAALLLLVLAPGGLQAQEAPAGPSVLVLTRALDPAAETTFQAVMTASLRLALERRGLVVKLEPRPAGARSSEDALLTDRAAAGADYLLVSDYGTFGRDLEVRLTWYGPDSPDPGGALTRRGPLDLALDRVILQAAEEILRAVNPTLLTTAPRPVAPPAPAGSGGSATPPQQGGPAAAPPLAPGGSEGNGSARGADTGLLPPVEPPVSEPQRGRRRKHVDIALGVGPFVTTGSASEYFKAGIVPLLNAAFLFRGERGRLGLGLYAGANLFDAQGSLTSASAFLVPMGVSFRYELGDTAAPLIIFGLAGGPALIGLSTTTGGQRSGLTVFGRGSLGIRLPIGDVFGIAAEAGYDVYWEEPYPIMGFCPAVYATLRL